jgi:hypothetical protein
MGIREHLPRVKTGSTWLIRGCAIEVQAFVETAPHVIRAP